MTSRERVLAALRRETETLDRIPMHDAFFADTLERWRGEGMPADVDPGDFFGFDMDPLYVDCSLRLPERLVEETDEYLVAEDKFGFTAKRWKRKAGIHYLDHRVKTRADWEAVKERLAVDVGNTARVGAVSYFKPFERYPAWGEMRAAFAAMRRREKFIALYAYGPYEHCWRMCGYTEAMMMLVAEPEWAEEIFAAHTDLLIGILRRAVAEGIRVDGLFLCEDLGVQNGPIARPAVIEALLAPQYGRLSAFLRTEGIVFLMHCCGGIRPLIPMLIECGVDVLQPLQATAGLDIRDLKPEFGRRLAFMGNINAKIMHDPAAVERELRAKIPAAAAGGGYIYSSDHSVPSDVSLAGYQRILARVRHSTGSCRPEPVEGREVSTRGRSGPCRGTR